MLFECHHEGIDFIGYSLFESKNGAYSKNILASNEEIEDRRWFIKYCEHKWVARNMGHSDEFVVINKP